MCAVSSTYTLDQKNEFLLDRLADINRDFSLFPGSFDFSNRCLASIFSDHLKRHFYPFTLVTGLRRFSDFQRKKRYVQQ